MSDDDLWALRDLAAATRLQDWMFAALAPAGPGPMLEIGAGIGTFSRRLLEAGASPLLLLEPEPRVADVLEAELGGDPRVEVVREAIPASPALRARPSSFRYALAQNVLEHIEDDVGALRAVVDSLEPGGELAVLVPAHPVLYGRLDERFGHVRRYTRPQLRSLIAAAGAELDSLRSFNMFGIPGWLAARTGLVDISPRSLKLYEALVRVWRPIEDVVRPPIGLSLIARAHRPW